jgi:pyruvate formate lyase activating enzyme
MTPGYSFDHVTGYSTCASTTGIVGNIQRFCLHDGPGLRTVVFLKGCPLRCTWCANPELQQVQGEVSYSIDKCLHCQRCVQVCPVKALEPDGRAIRVDQSRCTMCGECFQTCPTQSLVPVGKAKRADRIIDLVLKDRAIYDNSGGGMTLSGGEPTVQIDFTFALLWLAKFHNLATAVETCGYASWDRFARILQITDVFLYDLKHIDERIHREGTGVGNEIIMENLERLLREHGGVVVRVPVIPGFNYEKKAVQSIIEYVISLKGTEVHLLPYHELGLKKYEKLGRTYELPKGSKVDEEELASWIACFQGQIEIKIGG